MEGQKSILIGRLTEICPCAHAKRYNFYNITIAYVNNNDQQRGNATGLCFRFQELNLSNTCTYNFFYTSVTKTREKQTPYYKYKIL